MKSLILTVAFTIAGGAMFAQATPETKEHAQHSKEAACPMPDMKAVQTLELDQEQLVQIREITTECERHCAQAKAETGSVDQEAMAQYQARVQEVLTAEQYAKYQALKPEHKMERMEKKEMKKAE